MKVCVTGASGLIGGALCEALVARGDTVLATSRRARADTTGVHWVRADLDDGEDGGWQAALQGCDAVVHLAGEPIGDGRWSAARKAGIRSTRVAGTRHLVAALGALAAADRPRTLVVANGIDYYPFDTSERPWDESAPGGSSFLAEVCHAWQAEAERAIALDMRVVTLRTGVVLAQRGGALARLVAPFKFFAGGRVGNGRQWFSWVHVADVVRAYLMALDAEHLRGPVNLVAPDAVRGAELARLLGAALRRPAWLPVPSFAVRLAAGGIAEYVTQGRRVVPQALLDAGFAFEYGVLADAFDDLLS